VNSKKELLAVSSYNEMNCRFLIQELCLVVRETENVLSGSSNLLSIK